MSDYNASANTTLSAFFNDRHDAEKAISRLEDAGIAKSSIRLLPGNESDAPVTADTHRGFFGALADFFMPDEDRYGYAEGLSRGGFLVAVSDLDNASYDRALDILDDEGAVDFDQLEEGWRAEGWTGYSGAEAATDNATLGSSIYDQTSTGTAATANSVGTSAYDNTSSARRDDETIPVVEESLKVGKRDVNLGRVRVRSYLREEPVSAQVNLRDEKVTLDRRPVDRPVDVNDAAFQNRTIEAEEHAEEAIVSKRARVVEEIGLRKESSERQETINDTVRKTEVEVEDERGNIDQRQNQR